MKMFTRKIKINIKTQTPQVKCTPEVRHKTSGVRFILMRLSLNWGDTARRSLCLMRTGHHRSRRQCRAQQSEFGGSH